MDDSSRSCSNCGEPLSDARRKAMPLATRCVPCVEQSGDVVLLKRFDEKVGGVDVQTYFKKAGQYLERALERRNVPDYFSHMAEEY